MSNKMTDAQISGFFKRAKALLANAKEGIEVVNVDYPQVIMEAISHSTSNVEVDSFISISETIDAVGEENAEAAIGMLIEQLNESLKPYKGEAVSGGIYKDAHIVSIKFWA